MNPKCGDNAYRFAMNTAMDQLDVINQEAVSVRNRMDQLDLVMEALKPFLATAEDRRPKSKLTESVTEPVPAPHMAAPVVVPPKVIEATDPIQRRINSVLGLAVA